MHTPVPYSAKIPDKAILSLLLASAILAPIAVWNSYVFSESNLPFLLALMILAALIFGSDRIPRDIAFPGIAISFGLFVFYAWLRLDNQMHFSIDAVGPSELRPGFAYVVDLIIFYFLFTISALLFYKNRRFSLSLWFLICGYVIAFVARNSLDIASLQEGFNLSPGYVLISLLPFAFLRNANNTKMPLIPSILLISCAVWLALIGARTAVATLVGFYIVMWAWPVITRNRFVYYGVFFGMLLSIACLTVLYLLYGISNPTDPLLSQSLIEDSDIGVLQKSVGTRVEIWIHLAFLISQQLIFGYGTDHGTQVVSPVYSIVFTLHRDNLSAHSLYFELLYRLGVVGLLGFILVMFSVWSVFWSGREQWVVRVAGAFLISILFFCSTGDYLVFSVVPLRSGFGWIILGIGAGACLHAVKDARLGGERWLGKYEQYYKWKV